MRTYYKELQRGRKFLKDNGIEEADVDAWHLLSHVLEIDRAYFFIHRDEKMPEDKIETYQELLNERVKNIPVQYITGKQEFMGLEFQVNENVLIPRQDTEILVEEVLKVCHGKTVLDLCTGSGCIIISLAKLGKVKEATASDISYKALEVARLNAINHNVSINFIESDLFEKIDGEYDIIVSNPPYISSKDMEDLMAEVKDYEPRLALDGSDDGLLYYRRIVKVARRHLKDNGLIFFEIGYNQGEEVQDLLRREGFVDISLYKDLAGLDRLVSGRKEFQMEDDSNDR